MTKRVILITGTPSVGKTTTAKTLAQKLNAEYINLTELATKENLTIGKDQERDTTIIDETKMKKKIQQTIQQTKNENIIIDGHYAAYVTPKQLVTYIFVLRRDPLELRKTMQEKGITGRKLWENLASEILDVCLVDALNAQDTEKICEIDTSNKKTTEIVTEILAVLNGKTKCHIGIVDWLGKLEREGILDECLRI
ncbi:MAG TPA: adenylate kinase family protein [Candidatus Bathyarchaeia archaeon]|nr:adenylate kinase family protein [Candidatus Bathyarchaeia archaeon]